MRARRRWLVAAAALVAAVVMGSSIAQAVRSGSWDPVMSTAWIPAVFVAIGPGAHRRCLPRGGGQARRADPRR
jgi:lipopolysaccharide export LptBFGC system permease protein LptF